MQVLGHNFNAMLSGWAHISSKDNNTLCFFLVRTDVTIRSMYMALISVLSLHVGIPCFNPTSVITLYQ